MITKQTDQADNGTTQPACIAFCVDPGPHAICGWAGLNREEDTAEDVTLSLMIGTLTLGTIARNVPRPDVDAYLGVAGPSKGFSIADFGIRAFTRITGLDDPHLVAEAPNAAPSRQPLSEVDKHFFPIATRTQLGNVLTLADIWLGSNRDVVLRFEGASDAVLAVDLYQCRAGAKPSLVKLAANQQVGGAIATVSARLLNPYLPILMVIKGHHGTIIATDIVPFPSLARGGAHAGERMIAGCGGDTMADMAAVSETLLNAFLRRPDHSGSHVTTIELDTAVHTGVEPILNGDLMSWLRLLFGIAVVLPKTDDTDSSQLAFIRERLLAYGTVATTPGSTLQLPADAIPTISALVHATPSDLAGQTIVGSAGIIEWGRDGAIWSVWMPPLGDWLDDFQPSGTKRSMPRLRVGKFPSANGSTAALDYPLALILRDKPTRMASVSPFEISDEMTLPLLNSKVPPFPLSVAILLGQGPTARLPLLESLARQQMNHDFDLVLCRSIGSDDHNEQAALEHLFPGRFSIVPVPGDPGRLEQIVAMRDALAEDHVLILDGATSLPDVRTIATLLTMLSNDQVATAGCLVRMTQAKQQANRLAGYVVAGLDLRTMPNLTFDAIDSAALLNPTTYPVVANCLSALITRRSILHDLLPHGSDSSRPEVDDMLLGLHALASGGLNLCTTVVSAYSDRPAVRNRQIALSLPYRLPSHVMDRILNAATVIQKIQ